MLVSPSVVHGASDWSYPTNYAKVGTNAIAVENPFCPKFLTDKF